MSDEKMKQWKPKTRWIKSITINLKEPGKEKYEFYVPKTEEEEREMQAEWDRKMEHTFDILFPERPHKALQDMRNKERN